MRQCHLAQQENHAYANIWRETAQIANTRSNHTIDLLHSKIYQHNLADHLAPAFVIIGVEVDPPRDPSPRFWAQRFTIT